MLNSRKYLFITATAVLLMLFPAAGYPVQVSFYIGDVKLIRNGSATGVSMGADLKSGDIIRTGSGAAAEIMYNDGSKISVKENSSLRIGSSAIKGSDSPSLISGRITGKFAKLKKGKNKVYTPTIVCAIRGTEFDVSVSKSGDSRVDLADGKLDINNPYGKVKLNRGQNVESGIAEKPSKKSSGSPDQWQNKRDKELENAPGEKGEKYNSYMKNFSTRNDETRGSMDSYRGMVKGAKNKKDLDMAGNAIGTAAEKTEDDLILNETANSAIEGIMDNFRGRKQDIYNTFEQVKRESNKVLEVQKQSYADIQAVMAEYQKAYEEIMGQFKKDSDMIKKGFDFDSVKPEIKKDKIESFK